MQDNNQTNNSEPVKSDSLMKLDEQEKEEKEEEGDEDEEEEE